MCLMTTMERYEEDFRSLWMDFVTDPIDSLETGEKTLRESLEVFWRVLMTSFLVGFLLPITVITPV